MREENITNCMAELEQQIAALPSGSITTKRIKGHEYYYHRQTVNGRRVEKYVPAETVDGLRTQIEERRRLQSELRSLQRELRDRLLSTTRERTQAGWALQQPEGDRNPGTMYGISDYAIPHSARWNSYVAEPVSYATTLNIRTGSALRAFSTPVQGFKRRACYAQLHEYVYGAMQDKVFILYGLRRTGKTTLIRQILAEMSEETLSTTAFIQVTAQNTLAELNGMLRYLEQRGCQRVFLDEVTLMEDFIQGAALFSDIFAASGMRLVLSGTDSLGFLFTEDEQLYDRCILLHTTFIPYREFESVLGIHGIDEYIRYGGTMSLGGVHYNETSTFATKERADEYVDTAIARNIQHSLRCYQYEGHFRSLQELYDRHELTSAINRIVEDMNHRFTLEVLTREFKSHDLALSARNLRNDRQNPTDILDHVDVQAVTARLRELLEIRNREEQTVRMDDAAAVEIREYLELLDLIQNIDVISMSSLGHRAVRTVIAQPGLRYAQADALIQSLLLDETLADLSITERNAICERIRSEIRGRMMEDITLLETRLAYPDKEVFVLQFPVGEFDMVVADPVAETCQIYEIRHSTEAAPEQYRHLLDADKCARTEHRYGTITERTVLYRGENRVENGIYYRNIETYLRELA